MKNLLKLLVIVMFLSVLNACEPDTQTGPDTDVRDNFVGTWTFSESSPNRSVNSTYSVVISKNPSNSSQVLLSNFTAAGSGTSAYGIVTSTSITVPSQTIATDYIVDGSGILSNSSTMNWSYSYTAGGDKTDCTATATK
ncbi:MAG: hypothetical protein ACOYMF_00960 [Bacteroidales bacterium]